MQKHEINVALFHEENFFPEKCFFIGKIPSVAKLKYITAEYLESEDIAGQFDALILPYGGYYPQAASGHIAAMLARGKDIIILGDSPFGSPCVRSGDGWQIDDPHDFGDRWRHSFTSARTAAYGLSYQDVPASNGLSSGGFKINIVPELQPLFAGRTGFSCRNYCGTLENLGYGRRRVIARAAPGTSTAINIDEFVTLIEPGFSPEITGRIMLAGFRADDNWRDDDYQIFLAGLIKVLLQDNDSRLEAGLDIGSGIIRCGDQLCGRLLARGESRRAMTVEIAERYSCEVASGGDFILSVLELPAGNYTVKMNGHAAKLAVVPRREHPNAKVCRKHSYAGFEIDGEAFPAVMYSFNPYDLGLDRQTKLFGDAGIHFYNFLYPPVLGWHGPEQYDWSSFDMMAARILRNDAHALLFPRLYLQTPSWWDETHPEELKVFLDGKNYIDNSYFANSRNSKYSMLGLRDRSTSASLDSELWRTDVMRMLDAFIRHVKSSPYRGNFLGGLLCCGKYGEWIESSCDNGVSADDYSHNALAAFRHWLREYYRGDEAIRQARWRELDTDLEKLRLVHSDFMCGSDKINHFLSRRKELAVQLAPASIEQAELPNFVRRHMGGVGILRDFSGNYDSVEYCRYIQDSFANMQTSTAAEVRKSADNEIIVGSFSAYLVQEFMFDTDIGINSFAFPQIQNAPETVDLVVSPFQYYNRENKPEHNANLRTVTGSFKLHPQIFLSENDQRTMLADNSGEFTLLNNCDTTIDETVEAIKRNFIIPLVHGAGLWYYDFGRGWYDHPRIMDTIARLHRIYQQQLSSPATQLRKPDALNVIYSTAVYERICAASSFCRLNTAVQVQDHLDRNGFPWEIYFLNDLHLVPEEKAYLFMNTYLLDAEDVRRIERLKRNGNVLIWLYAPGLYRGEKMDAAYCEEVCGISLKTTGEPVGLGLRLSETQHQLTSEFPAGTEFKFGYGSPDLDQCDPEFYVDDDDAVVLGYNPHSGHPTFAVKDFGDWKSVYLAAPLVPHQLMRQILCWAGLTPMFTGAGDAFYSDGSLFGTMALTDGEKIIRRADDFVLEDLFSGQSYYSSDKQLALPMKRKHTFIGRFAKSWNQK